MQSYAFISHIKSDVGVRFNYFQNFRSNFIQDCFQKRPQKFFQGEQATYSLPTRSYKIKLQPAFMLQFGANSFTIVRLNAKI